MSNKVIVLWGFIIVSLVCGIYYIGVKYENELKYIDLKDEIKEATKKYISDNDKELPFKITTEELEEQGYINTLKLDNKICAADVKAYKKFMFNRFDIKFTCINEEQNDN